MPTGVERPAGLVLPVGVKVYALFLWSGCVYAYGDWSPAGSQDTD